ncbi:MAG: DEAD/DEAH box helicase, partial [Elusimicrobiota bacterium]
MDMLILSTGVPSLTAERQADAEFAARAEGWARWSLSLEEEPEPGWVRGLVWRILPRGALVPPGSEMEAALLTRFGARTAAACAAFHRFQAACALAVPGGVPERIETDISRRGDFSLEEARWLSETARRDIERLWSELARLYPDEGSQLGEEPLFVSWTGVGRGGWRNALVDDAAVEGAQEPVLSTERMAFRRDDVVLASLANRLLHVEGLRPGQAEGAAALLSGRDLVLTLPTGGGKSLCYQLAALLTTGTPLVAAPLRALLRDQARRLRTLGITRIGLLSGDDPVETRRALSGLREGKWILALAAPERLDSGSFRDALRATAEVGGVPFVAIDEAHCAARRSHDWRPAYRALGARLRVWGSSSGCAPALAALSGGATPGALAEAERVLGLRDPIREDRGSSRANLSFREIG